MVLLPSRQSDFTWDTQTCCWVSVFAIDTHLLTVSVPHLTLNMTKSGSFLLLIFHVVLCQHYMGEPPDFSQAMFPYYQRPRPLAVPVSPFGVLGTQFVSSNPSKLYGYHGPHGPFGSFSNLAYFSGTNAFQPQYAHQHHQYHGFGGSARPSRPFPLMSNFQGFVQPLMVNDPYVVQLQQVTQPSKIPSSVSPPFGFIEKQVRNPNSNPSDIARVPPPKAIMTTAADVLGLGSPGLEDLSFVPDEPSSFPSETRHASTSKNHVILPSEGREKTNGKESTNHINFFNAVKSRGITGGYKSRFTDALTKLKTVNGTEIEVAGDDQSQVLMVDTNKEPTFISEPILGISPMWSFKSNEIEPLDKQPHNILPISSADDFDTQLEFPLSTKLPEPIPLFTTEAGGPAQDDFFEDDDEVAINSVASVHHEKPRIYHCPAARNLQELSQAEVYPDPLKCDQFYYCKWGKAYVFKCPLNHFFNPYLKACDEDEDFACAMSLKKK